MDYILLILGFILLIKGADILVSGASSVASKFGISTLVIGLTIVAFGSSAPELVVSIVSALNGKTDLALGNIVGSNISNLLLILGATALVYPISMPHSTVKKEIPFLIIVTIILLTMIFYDNEINFIDSMIFILFFIGFLFYVFKISKNKSSEISEEVKIMSNIKSTIYIILGLVGLIGGGNLIVSSASNIAEGFGLSEAFIGVTIVAIGTSLPELAASMVAAYKKDTDMAIGGVVGSNIFNTLWILGLTGSIYTIPGYSGINTDLYVNLFASVLILIFAVTFKKMLIDRAEGILLLILYFGYIGYLISNI